ncbi:MAG: hypothetical protein ACM3ML_39525 [Micromonosporaceae bacterium]
MRASGRLAGLRSAAHLPGRIPGPRSAVRFAVTLAALAAVVQCTIWPPATAVIAAEGLIILGILLALDMPWRAPRATMWRWLRRQLPSWLTGAVGTAAVLAALAVPAVPSAWIAVTGLVAVAAAYLIAIPRS